MIERTVAGILDLKKTPLWPSSDEPRYACPFYGFGGLPLVLMDTKGNQCALVEGHSPCRMKLAELTPNWKACRFNKPENQETINALMAGLTVFPEEFRPPGESSWKGVFLKDWADYVMNVCPQRPCP